MKPVSKLDVSIYNIQRVVYLIIGIWIIFSYGSPIILPLIVSVLIATLLNQVDSFFRRRRVPKWLSITLTVLLFLAFFTLLALLIISQIERITQDWPEIQARALKKYAQLDQWFMDTFNLSLVKSGRFNSRSLASFKGEISVFLSSITNLISQSFIILIYVILLLMQKEMFIRFLKKIFHDNKTTSKILSKSAQMVNIYLLGKIKLMVILFVIYYIGFLIGKVPYSLFLALFAALFSIIPYVGNLIGGGVAVMLSYLFEGLTPAIIVISVMSIAQILENYVLTPLIIGEDTDLNPFITIFGVILFSFLWGIVGAIIALPIIAILKVFFTYTKGLEPYAELLKNKY